jgi:Uma2 family endonuclease
VEVEIMETVFLDEAMSEPAAVVPLTVGQYHQMRETGILEEDEPIELLNGLLVHKDRGGDRMPVSPRHALVVSRTAGWAPELEALGCHVRHQNPVTIEPRNEPEPDVCIVRGRPEDYLERHPGPDDVHCLIEVADSSLKRDRSTKKAIYAAAGIPQYVIVNLADRRIEVYEDPNTSEGTFGTVRILTESDTLAIRVPGPRRLEVPAAQYLPS